MIKKFVSYTTGVAVLGSALALGKISIDSQKKMYEHLHSLPRAEYTIKTGDTIWKICDDYISDTNKYNKNDLMDLVIDINKIEDAGSIRPGKKIKLPIESPQSIDDAF